MTLKLNDKESQKIVERINFEKCNGLLPAVIQDESDGRVLMQAFMNPEALLLTLKTGKAHYWSRTRQKIWMKGENSGNIQLVQKLFLDCDYDAILLHIQQKGVCCHTGKETCFHHGIK